MVNAQAWTTWTRWTENLCAHQAKCHLRWKGRDTCIQLREVTTPLGATTRAAVFFTGLSINVHRVHVVHVRPSWAVPIAVFPHPFQPFLYVS